MKVVDILVINIGKQFSRFPAGRYIGDGDSCGQKFREDWIVPAISVGTKVAIEFDDALGYGSSFLEEAFGGLVRSGFSKARLKDLLKLVTSDESLKIEVEQYIDDAVEPRA